MAIKAYNYETPTSNKKAVATGSSIKPFTYAPEPPKEESFFNKTVDKVKQYAQESADTVETFGNAILHPLDTIKKAPDPFMKAAGAGIDKAAEGVNEFNEKGAAKKVAGTAKIIAGLAQTAFSPITGLFDIASNIPGAKQVADAINVPFTAAGVTGSFATGKIIDWIPDNVLSKESKKVIKEPLQEISSTAFQILLGGKIMDKISKLTEKGEVVTPKKAEEVIVEAQTEAHKIAMTSPEEKYSEYRKSQGYESYVPENELPVIDFGKAKKSTLPVIDIADKVSKKKGEFTYEPIISADKQFQLADVRPDKIAFSPDFVRPAKVAEPVAIPINKAPEIATESRVVPISEAPKPPKQIIDGVKPSGVAKSIEAKAVQKGLTESLNDLAGFDPITIKEQASLVSDLINTNFESARKMIRGQEEVPENIRGAALIVGMEEFATKTGDVGLLQDLARSPLVSETSRHAQELRLLAERSPDSPVKIIKDINTAREKAVEKKTGKKVSENKKVIVKEIQEEIKKKAPSKQTWSEFIDSIKC